MSVPTAGTRAHAHWMARQNRPPQWYEAPLPRRWHRCQPFTSGSTRGLASVDRCACGGIRLGEDRPWLDRNSRRRAGKS